MYTIKILNDTEFDKLPHKRAKEALGCADAKKQVAWVRQTGVQGLDMFTIQHEVEELAKKISPHEEDGIRYKKGRDIMGSIGPMILGAFNPLLGAAASAGYTGYKVSKGEAEPWQIPMAGVQSYWGSQGMRGGKGFQSGVDASKAAGGGWFGQGLSGLQGMVGVTPGAARVAPKGYGDVAGGTTTGTGMGGYKYPGGYAHLGGTAVQGPGGGMVAGRLDPGQSPYADPTGSYTGGGFNFGQGSNVNLPPVSYKPPSIAPATGQQPGAQVSVDYSKDTGKGIGDWLGTNASKLLGGGLTLGSGMVSSPQYPDLGEITRRYVGEYGKGVTPIGQMARGQLTDILQASPEELFPIESDAYWTATLQGIEDARVKTKEQITKDYAVYNKVHSSEHMDALAEADLKFNQEMDRAKEEANSRRFVMAKEQKYDAIKTALNLDDRYMEVLLYGDIQTAMGTFQAQYEDIESIRKAMGTWGGELLAGTTTETA